MLGSMIIGAEAARQQQVDQVTGANDLGPMIITAEDRDRALQGAGLAPIPVVAAEPAKAEDKTLTVREVAQLLRANPAGVSDVVKAEAARAEAGLEVRVTVLKLCRPVAEEQGLADLVAAIDDAVAKLLSPGDEG